MQDKHLYATRLVFMQGQRVVLDHRPCDVVNGGSKWIMTRTPVDRGYASQAGPGEDFADEGGVALAMEHVILEAYRLMQAGQPQQAEYLLIEGPTQPVVRSRSRCI